MHTGCEVQGGRRGCVDLLYSFPCHFAPHDHVRGASPAVKLSAVRRGKMASAYRVGMS